jgi:hypothetical protein
MSVYQSCVEMANADLVTDYGHDHGHSNRELTDLDSQLRRYELFLLEELPPHLERLLEREVVNGLELKDDRAKERAIHCFRQIQIKLLHEFRRTVPIVGSSASSRGSAGTIYNGEYAPGDYAAQAQTEQAMDEVLNEAFYDPGGMTEFDFNMDKADAPMAEPYYNPEGYEPEWGSLVGPSGEEIVVGQW